MSKNLKILHAIIEECRNHQSRMNYAFNKLANRIPLDAKGIISDEIVAALDQYIFRFSKLQDTIGQRLFKESLRFFGEEVYSKPFLDIFNRLEQLRAIKDYELWNDLRIIRNEIAQEYDENKSELIEKLNRIISSKTILENYLESVVSYLKRQSPESF